MSRAALLRGSILIGVVVAVSAAYFYQGNGWNQNTRLDFVRAVVEHQTVHIDRYASNTGDKARYEGHIYSDKAPGEQLTALVPAEAVDWVLDATGISADSPRGREILGWTATAATSALPAALAAVALFWIALRLGSSRSAATITALTFGLATPMWAYATMLYESALATACLLAAFAAALSLAHSRSPSRRTGLAVVLGLIGGWAVITEYATAPAVALIALLAIVMNNRDDEAMSTGRLVGAIALGAALPLAVLATYNLVSFGSPIRVGYHYEIGFHALHQGVMGITYPRLRVAGELLAGPYRGLIFVAPALVLAPIGLALLLRRRRMRPVATTAVAIAVYFVLYNAAYVYWTGGSAWGPRFLAPALPFLCLGIAPLWDTGRAALRVATLALVAIGALLTLAAVTTTVQPAQRIDSPLTTVIWPALRSGRVALDNRASQLLGPQARVARYAASDSSNLGLLLGVPGLWSVTPLVACWLLCALVGVLGEVTSGS